MSFNHEILYIINELILTIAILKAMSNTVFID